ncbi:hypothetical protein [Sporosarcina sp. FSL W7-1283]|uniref:hypothetical protein n=1 Tax=Sporosarcina sp. FSL W7-1283 TaxID=2921560 RepID=UPI0030F4D378
MRNSDIKLTMKKQKIYFWMLADQLGCHENSVYKMFRYELTDEQKRNVLQAIDRIQLQRKESCQ